MFNKEKYGLVLAGGGGKGGYEIGVWKALKESKMQIGAVSGTSVGALNAALYAAGDYGIAEKIWLNITADKILTPDIELLKKELRRFIMPSCINFIALKNIGILGIEFLIEKYLLNKKGMFCREGLKEIIEESGVLRKITKDSIPCFATCYNLTHMRTQSFCLNSQGADRITRILLASSAIPVVFPSEEIDGNTYYDGGLPAVGENVPVTPLYQIGFRKFIVVHLNRDVVEAFASKFKGAEFVHVFPKRNQGGLLDGTLDFDSKSAKKRIDEGYRDMMYQIQMLNNIDDLLAKRNDNAEEIHIYAGKYYSSLNSIFDKCDVEMENSNLIRKNEDFVFEDMNDELNILSGRMKKNKREMQSFVLKGITCISTLEAQQNALHRSKGMKKLWNDITGKNQRLKQGIDSNLLSAQQATVEMISRLVETDAMNIELIRTVQAQLQGATVRMGHILEQHGYIINDIKNDYKDVLEKYNELVLRDEEIASGMNKLYEIFFEKEKADAFRELSYEKKMEEVKDIQRLQNWRMNIKYQSFMHQDYRELDIEEKIICVVSDFFFLTKGEWDDQLLLFVKSALDELEIDPCEIITYSDLVYKLIADKNLRNYLFKRNGVKFFWSGEPEEIMPHYEKIMCGIYLGGKIQEDKEMDTRIWVQNFMEESTKYGDIYGSTAFDIVCELLVILLQYQTIRKENELLPAYRDIKKEALLGNVDAECRYVQLLLEHDYVEEAFHMIEDMDRRIRDNSSFDTLRTQVINRYLLINNLCWKKK